MIRISFVCMLVVLLVWSCRSDHAYGVSPSVLPAKIAFGSCLKAENPMPPLRVVASLDPDLFIFLGDNVYADTYDMSILREKYAELGRSSDFQYLKSRADQILATWDDHDYGMDDVGKGHPKKIESKAEFMKFWHEPSDSDRWKHEGIYTVKMYESGDKQLQIILLDTRYFRDDLLKNDGTGLHDYLPNFDPKATILGEEQWKWLEIQLRQSADVRLIVSSTQFAHEYNGYESWRNFPHEHQRLLTLIKTTQANGILMLSGDVHWGELSKIDVQEGYPIYDMTSSGINRNWPTMADNRYRVGEAVSVYNAGMLEIDWNAVPITLTMSLYDSAGNVHNRHVISLDEISHSRSPLESL